jgi:hypothetical protein
MKRMKPLLVGICAVTGIVLGLLLFIRIKDRLAGVISDRTYVYEAYCSKNSAGIWSSPEDIGFRRTPYRVSFRDQFVVAEGPMLRKLRNCTVSSAERWQCEEPGIFPGIYMQDGRIANRCIADGSCTIAMTPVQYAIARMLHPLDGDLRKHANTICNNRAGSLELMMMSMHQMNEMLRKP